MAIRVRSLTYELGALESWPASLLTSLSLILASPTPMLLWWGEAKTLLYNDAAIPLLGRDHPAALGTSGGGVQLPGLTLSPVLGEGGAIVGVLGTRANNTNDMLATIGHELRNPLAALSTTLQVLQLRSPSSAVDAMHRALAQLTRVVSDLVGQSEVGSPRVEVPEAAVAAQLTRKRLLLVEDHDDAARALQSALEGLGYVVAVAHDAPIALNLVRTFQPDVALLDLGLPVMDGWELARRLRSAEPELPIIAITARDQEADRRQSKDLGFTEHLVKPVELAQLTSLVESLPARPQPPA